jgi:hypothetical protein
LNVNVWNTEPTVPSTEKTNFLQEKIVITYDDIKVSINVYDTPLASRFIEALKDNLKNKRILEKNFCFLGFTDSKRDLNFLCKELNKSVEQINSFEFDPPYQRIHPFRIDDFQYSSSFPVGWNEDGKHFGLKLKHESCNLLHRYFEDLQGTAWKLSPYYKQADLETKYAIRQLNNLCHEIESWVDAYRKKMIEPEWIRPSQITTFLNAPRFDLEDVDFELFEKNRYERELGGVYLHWSQVGKTLYEVFRDEGGVKINDTTCSTINHQKFYSGEFDVEWGQTISEEINDFKKNEMDKFRKWLAYNNYDWKDPKLSLGYIKVGQIDLGLAFGKDAGFTEIYHKMSKNLNIKNIKVTGIEAVSCDYPYTLDSDDWKKIQLEGLNRGYQSSSLR